MIPTIKQWNSWSLPSKLTAISTLIGAISLFAYASEKLLIFIQDSEHANTEWYIGTWAVDIDKTRKKLPIKIQEFKKTVSKHGIELNIINSKSARYNFESNHGRLLDSGYIKNSIKPYEDAIIKNFESKTTFVNFTITPYSERAASISITKSDFYWPEYMQEIDFPDSTLVNDSDEGVFIIAYFNIQTCTNCDPDLQPGNEKITNEFVPYNIYLQRITKHSDTAVTDSGGAP